MMAIYGFEKLQQFKIKSSLSSSSPIRKLPDTLEKVEFTAGCIDPPVLFDVLDQGYHA